MHIPIKRFMSQTSIFHISLHPSLPPPPLSLSDSDEDDWNIVIKECSTLAAKWENVSGYLGLSFSLIDDIKGDSPGNLAGCWNEALKNWIKQNYNTQRFGLPSWRTLLEGVARVDRLLFKKLAYKHKGTFDVNVLDDVMTISTRCLTRRRVT